MKARLKFVLICTLAFALIVPVGTILHELGHYIVAQFYYDVVNLHRASVSQFDYKFVDGEEFAYFLIIIAGPISTLLWSTVGILLISKSTFQKISFSNYTLPSVIKTLLAFFISREILVSSRLIFSTRISNSDEYKIPNYLNLDIQYFNAIIFIIATSICFYILNKTVEFNSKVPFLISAILGCGIGFYFWVLF